MFVLEFQSFVISTLVHLKHEINSIANIVQSNHMNIESLLTHVNSFPSNHQNNESDFDITLPIENDDDLHKIEAKITSDNSFRSFLVSLLFYILK